MNYEAMDQNRTENGANLTIYQIWSSYALACTIGAPNRAHFNEHGINKPKTFLNLVALQTDATISRFQPQRGPRATRGRRAHLFLPHIMR